MRSFEVLGKQARQIFKREQKKSQVGKERRTKGEAKEDEIREEGKREKSEDEDKTPCGFRSCYPEANEHFKTKPSCSCSQEHHNLLASEVGQATFVHSCPYARFKRSSNG